MKANAGESEFQEQKEDFGSTIRSLLISRLIIVTALLGTALFVRIFYQVSADAFYFIIGATFVLTLFYTILATRLRHSRLFVFTQLLVDQILISSLVFVTGGLESSFIILFYLPIVVSAVILGRLSSLLNALLAIVCLLLVTASINTDWIYLSVLFPTSIMPLNTLVYTLILHIVAMSLVAMLSGYLSLMLQKTATTLRIQTRDLMRLQMINDSIVKNIGIGIFTADLESRIRFANPAARNLLGRSESDLLDTSIYQYLEFNPEAPEPILGKQKWTREMFLLREDGSKLEVSVSRSYFESKDSAQNGKLYIIQNLEEIKNLRRQLIIRDRLAIAGEMSAAMAHEIRNPLAAISGSAQMIRQAEELPEEMQSLTEIIVNESERLTQTLGEYLTFARQPKFSPNKIDLAKIVRETIALIRNSPQVSRAHKLHIEHAQDSQYYAHADPAMVKQLVYNIVLNGIRAMPDGGNLTVTLNQEEAGTSIKVVDTGIGVPEEMMERLFQPFATRGSGGVGLGLAVVFRIVKEHGGTIAVRSSEDEGTAFKVLLPAEAHDTMNFRVKVESGNPADLD
jgi:two-component system sensor histidine kinase PilS (NtrC family)